MQLSSLGSLIHYSKLNAGIYSTLYGKGVYINL